MVEHPADYPWSSYNVNAGLKSDPLVSLHPEVLALGSSAYAELVTQALEQETLTRIRQATSGGFPVSDNGPQKPGRRAKPEKSVSDTDLFSGDEVS